jgi:hypothetical protein
MGANHGRPEYLYLSTDRVDARFYGYMNDEDRSEVLAVSNVPLDALAVDAEDSQTSTVEEEMAHDFRQPLFSGWQRQFSRSTPARDSPVRVTVSDPDR